MAHNGGVANAVLETLTMCEQRVWDGLVSGDVSVDAAALDDRFLGVYADGFADKAAHMAQLKDGPSIASFALSQLCVMVLSDIHAVLSYRAEFTRTSSALAEVVYVSSIWQRQGASWVNILSQDTPALS